MNGPVLPQPLPVFLSPETALITRSLSRSRSLTLTRMLSDAPRTGLRAVRYFTSNDSGSGWA